MTNKYAHKQSFTKEREQNYRHGAWHRRKGKQFIMLSMKGGKSMHVWVGRNATSTWRSNRSGGAKERCMGLCHRKKGKRRNGKQIKVNIENERRNFVAVLEEEI